MAYITGSVIDSFGVLPFSLSAGTQLSMSIQNSLPGVSYYGLETVPDGNGFYNPTTAKNLSGSFILGSGIVDVVYDNYKMVAAVAPGGGTLTYTPAVAIEADTLRTRGTGASLGRVDFDTLVASSYSKRVTTAGGYVESPDSITAAIAATPILKDASFLYIPSGYSSGTAFSELSTNDYGDLTWTRASDGTRTNSSGLVQRVPWNEFENSNLFTSWGKTGASVTITSGQTDPSGGTNAFLYARTLAFDYLLDTVPSNKYTVYCTVKKATSNFFRIAAQTLSEDAIFNINTGVIQSTTSSDVTATIQSLGDGWYKCIAVFNVDTTGFFLQNFPVANGSNGNGSVYIYQAQANIGTSPQPYLPTTTRLNVPRLDYTYGTSPASLLEPQRTNLSLWSDDFSQSTWAKSNTTVTTNNTTSPDGSANADKLIASATTSTHLLIQNPAGSVSGSTVTVSIFAKASELSRIQFVNNAGGVGSADYNLSAGTVNFASGVSASIVNSGNGWYRCILSYTPTTTGTFNIQIRLLDNSGNTTFTGNGTDGLFIYGAQLESGSYSTTYIPTTSATATRVADSFSRNNIYTNGLITSSGGTWFVELRNNVAYVRDSTAINLFLGDNITAPNNAFVIRTASSASTRLSLQKVVAGSFIILTTPSTDTLKIAFKWNGMSADVFVNGVKGISATAFTTTNMEFLSCIAQNPTFIQQMALYPSPLSDTDCTTLTTL